MSCMAETQLRVELFWQPADGPPSLRPLLLPAGSTLADAVAAAGLSSLALDAGGELKLALWGRLQSAQTPLHDGDRVELLRPLRVDPKQARRLRARRR